MPKWRLEERRREVRAPEAAEVRVLLKAAEADDLRLGILLRLLAASGMRRGEACALRWSDVDFEDGVLLVDESMTDAPGGPIVKAPKTQASVRRIACDPMTADALARLHREQDALASACGLSLLPGSFVFSAQPGGESPPNPDAMSHALARIRERAGLPVDIHLHSLRHFHATALDPVVSERQKQARLGWSTVHMARHDTDAIPEEDRRAAAHVGRLLGAPLPPDAPSPDETSLSA